MPGPGPHLMYTLAVGTGLMGVSKGRFTPHHCLIYAVNAFLGPDIGSFSEWLTSTIGMGQSLGSRIMDIIHHPLYYILILGIPLSVFYSWLSKVALQKGFLSALSGVPLSRLQCLLLISAGALSHFFLDHLFEENGHSTTFTWIISTGWWEGRAPVNSEAVIVVGILCTCLLGGFIYINRQYKHEFKALVSFEVSYGLQCDPNAEECDLVQAEATVDSVYTFPEHSEEGEGEVSSRRRTMSNETQPVPYISYAALSANNVPCPISGQSYYHCNYSDSAVNPYTRSCTAIARCERDVN